MLVFKVISALLAMVKLFIIEPPVMQYSNYNQKPCSFFCLFIHFTLLTSISNTSLHFKRDDKNALCGNRVAKQTQIFYQTTSLFVTQSCDTIPRSHSVKL